MGSVILRLPWKAVVQMLSGPGALPEDARLESVAMHGEFHRDTVLLRVSSEQFPGHLDGQYVELDLPGFTAHYEKDKDND